MLPYSLYLQMIFSHSIYYKEANDDIASGIATNNFTVIMKAAHKIKGSASYLCCSDLKNSSLKLQDAAKEGTTNASEDNMIICRGLYSQWQEHFKNLVDAIKAKNL